MEIQFFSVHFFFSQIHTANKSDLKDRIGSVSSERNKEIIEGIKLLIDPLPDPKNSWT